MFRHKTIALISGKNPLTVKSGYARYSRGLAKNLTALGHEVHIYCVGRTRETTITPIGTIHQIYVPFLLFFTGREMATLPYAAFILAKSIKPADVVWGVGPWTLAGVLAQRGPIIADYFTSLSHEYGTRMFSPIERYLFKRVRNVVTHYRSTECILKKEFGISTFTRIAYTVDIHPRPHRKTTTPILLTIARNDPRKGLSYLYDAYAHLRRTNIQFTPVLVGPGQPGGQIENITTLLAKAYAFILPSIEEGSGSLAILEAMAAGLPIVATNIDGIPEDVKNGVSGILVPPKDSHALTQAITYLLHNPKIAKRMGQNAKAAFSKKYTSHTVQQHLRQFIKSIDTTK